MTDNLQYKFKLPIGDSSGDGHEKCEWFTIKSNVNLEEVTKAYLTICEKYGTSLSEICSGYEDNVVTLKWLQKTNLLIWAKEIISGVNCGDQYNIEAEQRLVNDKGLIADPEIMANLFITWIMKNYPDIKMEIEEIPIFPDRNADKQRKIDLIGYGLFY